MVDPAVAADGSPVEVYARLPDTGEAELIHSAVAPDAEILELGCGAGRVTRGLLALGHPVVAVDSSAEMLARIEGAEAVRSEIETLELGRRFPVVVLGSHLVNTADGVQRDRFLLACLRHLHAGGSLLIEAYPPEFDWPSRVGRTRVLGDVAVTLRRADIAGARLTAAVEYRVDGRTWRQEFAAELLDDRGIVRALRRVGLHCRRWIDRERGWLEARSGEAGAGDATMPERKADGR